MPEKIPEVTLTWPGKHETELPVAAPGVMTQLYPATPTAKTRGDAKENRIYAGENLEVMTVLLADFEGKVDCIYIDPPFNSGTDYAQKIQLHRGGTDAPKRYLTLKQYGDRWETASYLQNMYERLMVLRRFLAPTGSIFVHCDWHASAALRLIMDEIFGPRNLINEIVWAYASGGGSKRSFGHKHDTILFYTKNRKQYYFDSDAVRVPYNAVIAEKRRDLFHPAGMVAPDVWNITRPPNHSNTWIGYPTQKPLEVMERAIAAACPPGGLVMDCFAGSGSTLVAAAGLGRRFLGVERNSLGVHLARRRLAAAGVGFSLWQPEPIQKPDILPGLPALKEAVSKHASQFLSGESLEDPREMVDWVAVAPDYDGGVFTPRQIQAPPRHELVSFQGLTGVGLVADVTGRSYFVRLGS